ncbi:MAG: toprim domain-containing protein [Pirellulaceae bacterium]
MSQRPYVDFREVKQKISIPEALEALGLGRDFVERNGVLTGVCPIHTHGPQPNDQQFKINKRGETWLWHCFGDCQRGGDVIELVKSIKNLSDEHVRFWFAEHFGERLSCRKPKRNQKVLPASPQANTADESSGRDDRSPAEAGSTGSVRDNILTDKVAKALKPLTFRLNVDLDAAMPYLEHRGITRETAQRFGLGLCRGKPGRKPPVLDGYVAAPIYRWPRGENENPVGYMGRWPGEDYDEAGDHPRYKVPGGFEISRVVYGLNEALDRSKNTAPLIVVEGVFKVLYLAQKGFPSAVSTFTASVSDDQVDILVATGRPIALLFDGNEAGYQGMRRGAAKLITRTWTRVVKLDEGVEPDHLTKEQLEQLLSFARES